jgi:TIR domain
MADIFISFIHEEEQIARAVSEYLEALIPKTKVFLASDKWQIYAGEDWLKKIFDALQNAKLVILLLSKRSVARPWVNFEAGAAWLGGKHVIPVCFKGLSKSKLPKPYSSLQALDLNIRDDQRYLLNSVCHHLGVWQTQLEPPPKSPLGPDKYAKEREPYDRLAEVVKAFEDDEPIPHRRFLPPLE